MSSVLQPGELAPSRPDALREYARRKLELADLVRALLRAAERAVLSDAIAECRALLARLAEDRFNLAFLGQFSRGKSSLMNALLGEAKLPTGALPLTSVVTTVAYGDTERVLLRREGWSLPQEIPLAELPEYVTQARNPGNEKQVKLAEIQLPNELLRLGAHFLDTPGIASAELANTRAARQVLPEADAAILVTSVESPLSEPELAFLAEIQEHARRVFVVLNKLDLVAEAERAPLVAGVGEILGRVFPGAPLELFALSAREGLRAKQAQSAAALAASGLLQLEAALAAYLRQHKGRDLLLRGADQAAEIAGRLQFDEITARIQAFRASVEAAEGAVASEHLLHASGPVAALLPACRICQRVERAVMDGLAQLQYDLHAHEGARRRHAAHLGFCPLHTWQYEAIASPQGVCAAYPEVLAELAGRLRRAAGDPGAVPALVASADGCPACCWAAAAEAVGARELAARPAAEAAAVCLLHLPSLLRALPGREAAAEYLRAEAAALERMAEDMRAYALKHDAVRRGLTTVAERRAAVAGLACLVGRRSVVAPWRTE